MPAQVVLAASALTAGLQSTFKATYDRMYKGVQEKLGRVMSLKMPTKDLTSLFAYFEAAPHARIWPRGEVITSEEFEAIGFNVTTLDWGLRISWHENDRQDDKINGLFSRAQDGGASFAILAERVFFQILLAATDNDLMPSIPNAPDGVAIHSATDGDGAARFGLSGGNIQTGTGVASPDAIRTDFFGAVSRFARFQDGKGQPLLDSGVVDQGVTLIYNAANEKVVAEAFKQSRTLQGGAAVTNIVLDSGLKVNLWPTQRITDNDMFVFLDGTPIKPIFELERMALRETFANMDNSDVSRDTGVEYLQWKARHGYGINIPYATVKINN
jgi:hypothetical protein